jgi:cytochrome bd-type quinol oxidase subunit 2
MINRLRWITLSAVLLLGVALVIARQQGAITDFAASATMAALIALATTVGVVTSVLLRKQRKQQE